MKRIIYSIIILFSGFTLQLNAQDRFQQVLGYIESNNTSLKALRERAKADKIGNKTSINLANPEVEFGYLWGSPASQGNRTDLNIMQTFDFPTAYRYRSQLINGQNVQVDLVYQEQAIGILQEARTLCVELVYQTLVNKQLSERLEHAKELANAYQNSFDRGDISIIEYNKTRLNLLNFEKQLEVNEVEINLLRSELERLNGGHSFSETLGNYAIYSLPLSFDQWFETTKGTNPLLQSTQKQVELSRKQEQLTRALNLPKIRAGYTSERILGTTLQGFTVGLSIPLWEGKNTVKHQKAQTIALELQQEDQKLQFRTGLKNQYDKASKLAQLLKNYNDVLKISNDKELLQKALDKGQLSLINYLLELSNYYEVIDRYLETEREYQLAVAQLQQWDR